MHSGFGICLAVNSFWTLSSSSTSARFCDSNCAAASAFNGRWFRTELLFELDTGLLLFVKLLLGLSNLRTELLDLLLHLLFNFCFGDDFLERFTFVAARFA